MGAGESSSSYERIQIVFQRHEREFVTVGDPIDLQVLSLSFEGFCRFYNAACEDRLTYVWQDISTNQYDDNLQRINCFNDEKGGSIRSRLAMDPKYESMINGLLPINCKQQWPTPFSMLVRFPQPHSLRQRLYEMKAPLSANRDNRPKISYDAPMLYSLSMDKEWRR